MAKKTLTINEKYFVNDENGILVKTGDSYVAKDIDTLPYVGDVFHAPDIRSLRSAMRRLFEDAGLTRRLSRQARTDAEKLTWPAVTRELAQVIERTHREYHGRDGRESTQSSSEPSVTPVAAKMQSPLTISSIE